MILSDAINIKIGSEQGIEVRAGTELVWPTVSDGFWTFDIPAGGEEIQLVPSFSGFVEIDWGDGDTDILVNNQTINHTY
jgi:hypothetical protein